MATTSGLLAVRRSERNPDETWRVEIDPRAGAAQPMTPGELLAHLAEQNATDVHLTGPGAYALPHALLRALKAPGLRWTLHVPARVHDPSWWDLADAITAHVLPGERVAVRLEFDRSRRRPVTFTHCALR